MTAVEPIEQFIEEIPPVRPHVTRLVTYRGGCATCGAVHSSHPLQTSTATGAAKVQLGPRARALAAALNKQFGLTMRKTCRVLKLLCGLTLSPGGLALAVQCTATKVMPAFDSLVTEIRGAAAVFADETSWYVGAPGYWLWTFTTADATVYHVDESRGRQVVLDMLGEDFAGILVSDCLASYENLPYRMHKCIAHHQKAIAEARDRPDTIDPSYLNEWKLLFTMVNALWKHRGPRRRGVCAATGEPGDVVGPAAGRGADPTGGRGDPETDRQTPRGGLGLPGRPRGGTDEQPCGAVAARPGRDRAEGVVREQDRGGEAGVGAAGEPGDDLPAAGSRFRLLAGRLPAPGRPGDPRPRRHPGPLNTNEGRGGETRRPPRRFTLASASGAAFVLLGIIIYVATDKGTIKITVDDPDVQVRVDGEAIDIRGLGEPIRLRAGEHHLVVLRSDQEIHAEEFVIHRGEDLSKPLALRATWEPKAEAHSVPMSRKALRVPKGIADAFAKAPTKRSRLLGGNDGTSFESLPNDRGLLVGFEYTMGYYGSNTIINSLRPIYLTDRGEVNAPVIGVDNGQPLPAICAKEGYAVGAIDLSTGAMVDGFRLVFMKIHDDLLLDPSDAYESGWAGVHGIPPIRLGGDGRPIVGLYGWAASQVSALGLIVADEPDEVRQFEGDISAVWCLCLSPDGRSLLSCGEKGQVWLWDVASGRQVRNLQGHHGTVWAVAFSPDGRRAATCGEDGTLRLWDVASGQELHKFQGHLGWSRSVAYSSDGRRLLTTDFSYGIIRLWEIPDDAHLAGSPTAADDPHGLRTEIFGDEELKTSILKRIDPQIAWNWGVEPPAPNVPADHFSVRWSGWIKPPSPGWYRLKIWSDDGCRLALDDTTLIDDWEWGAGRGGVVEIQFTDLPRNIKVEMKDSVGIGAATLFWSQIGGFAEQIVPSEALFQNREAAVTVLNRRKFNGLNAEVFAGEDFKARIDQRIDANINWNWGEGPPAPNAPSDHFSIRWTGWLKAPRPGRYRLTLQGDDGGRFWLDEKLLVDQKRAGFRTDCELDLDEEAHALRIEYFDVVGPASVSLRWSLHDGFAERVVPTEALFVDRGAARRTRVPIPEEVRGFLGHQGEAWFLAWSPDGRQFASTGRDGTIRLWSVETGLEIAKMDAHAGGTHSISYSLDGKRLLSAGDDCRIRLWDVGTRKVIQEFVGHTGWVVSAALSADGRRILSASTDRTVRLWDVETGRELRVFGGHLMNVWSVTFTPDGRFGISGGSDQSIRVWRLPE